MTYWLGWFCIRIFYMTTVPFGKRAMGFEYPMR